MRVRGALEVWAAFLKLGLSAFGGPIAHIGYFREAFVVRRRWLDDAAYVDLVALCQFLPGPASSQVCFSLGLVRAGYWGGLAAWTGFTLPSALAMTAFAYGAEALSGPAGMGLLHGLRLAAVAIVAQAVYGMARSLCPDRARASIAGVAAVISLFSSIAAAQIGVILLGAMVGLCLCRDRVAPSVGPLSIPVSRRVGILALCAYFLLLASLPVLSAQTLSMNEFAAFYRSGALVFGGGHVVLPLLRNAFVVPGWISEDQFLAGYGAAQAVPGPLFTFAAYLGAISTPTPNGIAGALLGVLAIFLPGMLVLLGTLPFWGELRRRNRAQSAMLGVNAAVVGLLGAALYDPLWTSSIKSSADVAIALAGFILLVAWRGAPVLVVILGAVGGALEYGPQ